MVSRIFIPDRKSFSAAGSSAASSLKNTLALPLKPLLKRSPSSISGTKRSRDEADLDPNSNIPKKRQKHVEFNPQIEAQIFEPYVKDIESVRLEVRQAIVEHIKLDGNGSSEAYDSVKETFALSPNNPDAPSPKCIATYLQALTSCVTLLNQKCNGLVRAVLATQWLGRDERFVKQYVHFLGNLVSAQGSYVSVVLEVLVKKFLRMSVWTGRVEGYPAVARPELTARLHMALKYLLRLIPSASSTLSSILSAHFPYPDETKKVHLEYINNLIKLIEYAPELRSDIFALIIDKLVKIDVQMQVDLEDIDDHITEAILNGLSAAEEKDREGEEEDEDSDDESVDSDEDNVDETTKKIEAMQQSVEKMDAILEILFTIYSASFAHPHSAAAEKAFDELLSQFNNIILPTYRSRHTQFLLFHFAQTRPEFIDKFVSNCAMLAFDKSRSAVFRQSAAAYLASFVARGAHVETHTVQEVFHTMGKELDLLRRENEKTCRGPDLSRYTSFYATTQALLYIFCFRWRDLTESDFDEEEDLQSQPLDWAIEIKGYVDRAVMSRLNPLKVCAPTIVEEFARITKHLNFIYIYDELARNKRLHLSQFVLAGSGNSGQANYSRDAGYSSQGENWYQLDAYFPFDPYQLPVSKKWIEKDYLVWKKIPGMVYEGAEAESSDEEEEDDDDEGGVVDEDDETDDGKVMHKMANSLHA